MTDPGERPWSNNPSAPNIPESLYFEEKVTFAGMFIALVLYGTCKTRVTCPYICPPFFHSAHYRDPHRLILSMYGRTVQLRQPQKAGHQVGAHVLHRGHVLACDHIHWDEPLR